MLGRLSSLLIALQFFIASICAASSPDFSWQEFSRWLETRVTWDISAPRPPLQAGVRITQEKFAVLDDYLPSVFTTEMKKFPDAAYEIAPTGDYFGDQTYRALSEKYSGQARIENGTLIFDGVGLPFPPASLTKENAEAGLQAAYNMYLRKRAANEGNVVWHEAWMLFMSDGAPLVRPAQLPADTFSVAVPVERMLGVTYQETLFSFVPSASPETAYSRDLPNAANIYLKNLMLIFAPYDMRGSFLNLTQYRTDADDDVRMYVPQFRQARRISGANRADSMFGSVWTLADLRGNSDKPTWWQWRLLGFLTTLHPMNLQHAYQRLLGSRVSNDVWEFRRCAMVEAIPNPAVYSNHFYSRKVLCIDTNTWEPLWYITFDRQGAGLRPTWISYKWSEDETGAVLDAYTPQQDVTPATKAALVAENHGRFTLKLTAQVGWDLQRGETTVYLGMVTGFPTLSSAEVAQLYDHNRLTELHR